MARVCLFLLLAALSLKAPVLADVSTNEGAKASALLKLSHRDKLYDVARTGGSSFVVGHPGVVLRSRDGGRSFEWLDVAHEREALFSIAFNKNGQGAIVGRSGAAFVSADGGATWEKREVTFERERPSLFAVDVLEDGTIVAVGEFGAIARSTDRGKTWVRMGFATELETPSDGEEAAACPSLEESGNENADAIGEARLTDVRFVQGGPTGFVVGEFGLVLRSDDGGLTFRRERTCSDKTLFALAAISPSQLIAVGGDGTVLESRDGGRAWSALASGTREHLFGVWADARRTVITGAAGTLLTREQDGPFAAVDTGLHTWLTSAALDDAGHGIVVGGRAHVLYTADGGRALSRLSGE